MAAIVQLILHKYLDRFFYGIDKKNIQTGILDGRITISNIGLQQNLLDNFNLPLKINYSYVEKIQINIPLFSKQKALNIFISNIYALISPRQVTNIKEIFLKKKQKAIQQGIKGFLQSLKEDLKNQKQQSYFKRKFIQVLDNINLNIGCIHFRYQLDKQYSFGLKINNIIVYNVNKYNKKQFFDRDTAQQKIARYFLSIDFIGLYFNPKQTKFIFSKNKNSSFFGKDTKKDYAYITNQMRHISFPQKISNHYSQDFQYFLVISVKTLLKHNLQQQHKKNPKFECDIEFNDIEIKITDQQYQNILQVLQFFNSFKQKWAQYTNSMNLNIYKEKNDKDIQQLLKQKNKKKSLTQKQSQFLRNKCRQYLKWLFLVIYEQRIKRKFIFQAMKKQITIQNLMKNKKIKIFMKYVKEEKLKNWTILAMNLRQKYLNSVGFLDKNNQNKIKLFLQKIMGPYLSYSKKQQVRQITTSMNIEEINQSSEQLFLGIKFNINHVNIQISKLDKFGVSFIMKNLRAQYCQRKQNFYLQIRMQDLQGNVFSRKNDQRYKTIVPIIKKSIIQQSNMDLLYLKYQKSPIGKYYINAEYELYFQSIQITIYPEAFKQFYEILFSDKKQQQKDKKKKENIKKNIQKQPDNSNQFQSINLLRNQVIGKIRSPWIIFPLGKNNNPQKQCWVVRLGDFTLQTPQIQLSDIYKQKLTLYEKYKFQLKKFELKFFSSVNFFYSWRRFNQNQNQMMTIDFYQKHKIINMIKPFTCTVDCKVLKSGMSQNIQKSNYKFIANVNIQGIQIFLSNFLLDKLKERIDIVVEQDNCEDYEFLQTNVKNIYQENTYSGWGQVTNQKFTEMKFYFVLKSHYIYFFRTQNQSKYYFFIDVRSTTIRLIASQVEKLNPGQEYKISIILRDLNSFSQWKKHIGFRLQKKQKKTGIQPDQKNQNNNIFKTLDKIESKQYSKKSVSNSNKNIPLKISQNQNSSVSSPNSKVCFNFNMNSLQITLKDKDNQEFLLCYFKKTNFNYKCLYTPEANFQLSSWKVYQSEYHKKNDFPFLSSQRFLKNTEDPSLKQLQSNKKQIFSNINKFQQNKTNNFLDVKVNFNEITNQLSQINVNIDKLFIAWKVDLITKILTFFFYSAQMGDSLAPTSIQKRTLGVNFYMQKFYLYAYQGKQLAGLIRLYNAKIQYFQSNIQQIFDVFFGKFQIDQIIDNNLQKKQALYICKGNQNPMKLKYHIRKKNYNQFYYINKYKRMFQNEDLIVTQLNCQLKGSTVYYEHQITFRMLNYFLNHVLGTVAAKFKKRSYSPKYISQLLKILKISTMNVSLKDFTFIVPGHQKNLHHLVMQIEQFKITKNINQSNQFLPKKIMIPTKFDQIEVFYESMLLQFIKVKVYQRYGKQRPSPINIEPFNMLIISSKINLSAQHYPVLNHYDDLDRLAQMKILFQQSISLQVRKIVFVTLLQIFYQNIKQRDGRAQIFQPPSPYPAKKKYIIKIPKLIGNLYEFSIKNDKMQIFNKLFLNNFIIEYNLIDTQSQMKFSSDHIGSEGQLSISQLIKKTHKQIQSQKQHKFDKKFEFKMLSSTKNSITKIQLRVQGYSIDFSFDKLNNLLQFINFDSDYVANKKMPSKPSSFMCVNVFAKRCKVILQQLYLQGQFFVTYLKNSKNSIQSYINQYLQEQNPHIQSNKYVNKQIRQIIKNSKKQVQNNQITSLKSMSNKSQKNSDIIDKQIKVDGQNIILSIKGDKIGQISSLYFHRQDFSTKRTMRRYKKQIVQIGQGLLSLQFNDLQKIYKAYDKRIKKSTNFQLKNFFQSWNKFPQKQSYIQKRKTQVEFSRITLFLIPNQKDKYLFYLMTDVAIPSLIYYTYDKQQQIQVSINSAIYQHINTLYPQLVAQVKKLKIIYRNYKDRQQKNIIIQNGNQLNVFLNQMNTQILYLLFNQISTKQKYRKFLNFNYLKNNNIDSFIIINNTTSQNIRLKIGGNFNILVNKYSILNKTLDFQQLLQIFKQDYWINISFVKEQSNKQIYKQRLKHVQYNKQICIMNQILIKFKINHNSITLDLIQGCLVKNYSKLAFNIYNSEQNYFKLQANQQKCILLQQNNNLSYFDFNKKIDTIKIQIIPYNQISNKYHQKINQNRIKKHEINFKNQAELLIFNGLINVKKTKIDGFSIVQIKQKYILRNFTPFKINIGMDNIIRYKQQYPLSINLNQKYSNLSSLNYQIDIDNVKANLNLQKIPQFIQIQINEDQISFDSKNRMKNNNNNKQKIRINIQKTKHHETIYIYLYTKIIIQSLCVEQLILSYSIDDKMSINDSKQIQMKLSQFQLTTISQDFKQLSIFDHNNLKQNIFINNFNQIAFNNKETTKQHYQQNCFIQQQFVNIVDNKCSQIKLKISHNYSIANLTNFKIKLSSIPIENQNKQISNYQIIEQSLQINSKQYRSINFSSFHRHEYIVILFMDVNTHTKYYRKVKITSNSIYYYQVGLNICKITTLVGNKQKKQSWKRIIIQISQFGYKIQNQMEQIVLQIKNITNEIQKFNNNNKLIKQRENYKKNKYQLIQDELNQQHQSSQILIQPYNFKQIGIKCLSSSGSPIIILQFYYPKNNVDFKQNLLIQINNLSLVKKQLHLIDDKTKTSFNIIILIQNIKQSRMHIKLLKKSSYQQTKPQIMKLLLKQIGLALYLSKNRQDKLKLQLSNLHFNRQKYLDIQNLFVKLQKILLIQANTNSIITALNCHKQFLNFQAILQKSPVGLKGKYISVKLAPFQINGRQGIFLKLLETIAKIRYHKLKNIKKQILNPNKNINILSTQQQKVNINININIQQQNIKKEWQLIKKGSKPISLQQLQILDTNIFISYKKSTQMLSSNQFINDPIIKYFLLLPSIGETKLPIPHLQIKNFNGTSKQLLKKIGSLLKSSIGQSILYSITSLAIFDNPIQAIDDLVRYIFMVLASN